MNANRLSLSKISRITLSRNHSPLSVEELAIVLELDLMTGNRSGFLRHLRRALNDTYRQGTCNPS